MKITGAIEQIFSQAVALDQSGNLKNTIYAIGNYVFILNFDHTVLLRFKLRKTEVPFTEPIAFNANDYESNEFLEEDGKIIFVTSQNGFKRRKSCKVPGMTPEQVAELFKKYKAKAEGMLPISIPKEILALLDRELSHIEFTGKKGKSIKMMQRNIYSGSVIEVQPSDSLMDAFNHAFERTIEPMGMRTNDFASLFSFHDVLTFHFKPIKTEGGSFVYVENIDKNKREMQGFISGCLYDELIEIKEAL